MEFRSIISVVLVLGVGSFLLPHPEVMTVLMCDIVLATNLHQGLSMSRVVRELELSPMRVAIVMDNEDIEV